MNKKNSPTVVLFIGIAVSIGILIGSFLDYKDNATSSLFSKNTKEEKIKRLINYIQYDYVDEVDTDSLLDNTINHLLKNLDPHSVYIPRDELQAIQENMNGSFFGIGIQFKGGPSEKAGLLAGDRILLADKDTLYGKEFSSNQIMDFLKGKEKNKVALTVYRKQDNEELVFTFNRGKVNLISVPISYMLTDSIGYIQVERFAKNTYDEFFTALESFKEKGMQVLVLDLRGNTGGYMDIANDIADEFLEDGKLIVFTKNKRGKITNSIATTKGIYETNKVYVLIDEQSASASEIVAGALQDNDRGIIVGRRSFGKGLVQQEMDLGDGSAVRLTTARYYTPTGRSIQKPYNHTGNDTYYNDLKNRNSTGELLYKDSIHVIDSLQFTTPKGKVVYGGGGIIPDIFVPIDTTGYLPTFHFGNITNFVFDYVDKDRKKYRNMTWDSFNKDTDFSKVLKQYIKSNTSSSFHTNITQSAPMKTYIKALIARELFGDIGYFRVYEQKDKMLKKVLELEAISSSKE